MGSFTLVQARGSQTRFLLKINLTYYTYFSFLFQGGFARVHELIDLKDSLVYAGKIIHKSRISKPHHKEKISREIELHRSLQHRNVVQFFKHFEDNENIYIMLENCARKSLVHVLKARNTVTGTTPLHLKLQHHNHCHFFIS